MKRAVGIDFTETSVRLLQKRGFSSLRAKTENAFQTHIFPLSDPEMAVDGFAIHVVSDEVEYLRSMRRENFHPFIVHSEDLPAKPTHQNTVEFFSSVVAVEDLEDSELKDFLLFRKSFPIAALHLKCRDLRRFKNTADPDRFFRWKNEEVALIHMGPSCFDLIVSQVPE